MKPVKPHTYTGCPSGMFQVYDICRSRIGKFLVTLLLFAFIFGVYYSNFNAQCLHNDDLYKAITPQGLSVHHPNEQSRIPIRQFIKPDVKKLNPRILSDDMVFKNNLSPDNITAFRIPILAMGPKRNTLVLFTEHRLSSAHDLAAKHISYKYSKDGGVSWSRLHTIFHSSDNGNIYLGSAIVDRITQEMFLIFTICMGPCPKHYNNASNIWTNYVVTSKDDGLTWSPPRNISDQIGSWMYCGGPGLGIQKMRDPYKHRLISCGHTEPLSVSGVFCLTSDDHGNTWKLSGTMYAMPYNQTRLVVAEDEKVYKKGSFIPDECSLVELPNGDVRVNIRNQGKYYCNCSFAVTSTDGCETLPVKSVTMNEDLSDPTVSTSIGIFNDSVLLFTHPNNVSDRMNLNLRWSYDFGVSWSEGFVVWPLAAWYSSLVTYSSYRDGGSMIFVAYEKGREGKSFNEKTQLWKKPIHQGISVAAIDLYGAI
jgi:sialidase-1